MTTTATKRRQVCRIVYQDWCPQEGESMFAVQVYREEGSIASMVVPCLGRIDDAPHRIIVQGVIEQKNIAELGSLDWHCDGFWLVFPAVDLDAAAVHQAVIRVVLMVKAGKGGAE